MSLCQSVIALLAGVSSLLMTSQVDPIYRTPGPQKFTIGQVQTILHW